MTPGDRLSILTRSIVRSAVALALAIGCNAPSKVFGQDAAEMRVIRGEHITLKADFGSQEFLRELVQSFDAAVPQWEMFWQLPPGTLNSWRVDAFVMDDADRFRRSGDLPSHLRFPFGYAVGNNLWVLRQQSEYYTRHLLLHEGAHSLAIHQFGSTGPSWYAEGTAEMLGLHQGVGNKVKINIVPASRDPFPFWGRFKRLQQSRQLGQTPTIDQVLAYPTDLRSDVEAYGWSWLAAMMFTQYDDTRPHFLQAARIGTGSAAFNSSFRKPLQPQWPIVQARWRLLAQSIDYGFQWQREKVDLSMKDPGWQDDESEGRVFADQGWQSTGVRYAPGMRLSLQPSGRCVLADQPKPWSSEPAGITIHYAYGRPLGQLLVCVLPNVTSELQALKPLDIAAVEPGMEIEIKQHCWLLFRVNDYLGDLSNNRGEYHVKINRLK